MPHNDYALLLIVGNVIRPVDIFSEEELWKCSVSDSPGTMSSTSSCLSSGQDPPIFLASESHQSHHLRCPAWNTSQSVPKANSLHTELGSNVHHKSPRHHPVAAKAFRGRSNSLSAMDTVSHHDSDRHHSAEMPEFHHRQAETSEDNLDFQELKFVENRSSVAPELAGAYFYVPEYATFGGKTNQVDSNDILPYML